jgi:hypothetical protein
LEQPLALVAAVPLSVAGPRPFAEWLNTLPAQDLLKITASVSEFVEAEAQWRAEHPKQAAAAAQPRRKNIAFGVNFKYTTGLAYIEWVKGAGHDSRAPHKECFV